MEPGTAEPWPWLREMPLTHAGQRPGLVQSRGGGRSHIVLTDVHKHMYVYTYICICMCIIYVYAREDIYIYISTYAHVCVYMGKCICAQIFACWEMHVCIHIYVYMYMYTWGEKKYFSHNIERYVS